MDTATFRMHKYETAHKHLTQSLALCPNGELTTGNIGICLFEMARYEEAIPFLEAVVCGGKRRGDLDHPDVGPRCLECYAKILRERKQYGESVKILKRLLKHKEFEQSQRYRRDEVYHLIARVHVKSKDFERALKYLRKAIKLNPGNTEYGEEVERVRATMNADLETTTVDGGVGMDSRGHSE